MPGFDPDQYLATKAAPAAKPQGFDPDAYLSGKNPPANGESNFGDAVSVGIRSAANAASLGTYPYAVAGVEELGEKVGLSDPAKYSDRVQKYKDLVKKGAEEHPIAGGIGTLGGAIASGRAIGGAMSSVPVVGGLMEAAPNAGKLANMGRAALGGGTLGFLETPEEGFTDLGGRLKGAGLGAVAGGGLQAIGQGAKSLVGGAKNLLLKGEETAQKLAIKQAGGMLKDFRQLENKGSTKQIGDFLLNQKVETPNGKEALMKVGDGASEIAEKAGLLKEQAGKAIGETYQKVKDIVYNPENFNKLSKAAQGEIAAAEPQADILAQKLKEASTKHIPLLAEDKLTPKIDEVVFKIAGNPNERMSLDKINQVRSEVDKMIPWGKKVSDMSPYEKSLIEMRKVLRSETDNLVDVVGKHSGDPKLAAKLKADNKLFSNSLDVSKMSADKAMRESSNNILGLPDLIVGAGAGVGGAMSGGDKDSLPERVGKGLATAAAYKYGRKYAPGLLAKGLQKASQSGLLNGAVNAAGKGLEGLLSNPAATGATAEILRKKRETDSKK